MAIAWFCLRGNAAEAGPRSAVTKVWSGSGARLLLREAQLVFTEKRDRMAACVVQWLARGRSDTSWTGVQEGLGLLERSVRIRSILSGSAVHFRSPLRPSVDATTISFACHDHTELSSEAVGDDEGTPPCAVTAASWSEVWRVDCKSRGERLWHRRPVAEGRQRHGSSPKPAQPWFVVSSFTPQSARFFLQKRR